MTVLWFLLCSAAGVIGILGGGPLLFWRILEFAETQP